MHRSPFIGRRRELEQIPQLFSRGERLVTIVAPPGSGKTRMAHELARIESAAGTLAGLAELGERRAAADLTRHVADILGVPLDGSAGDEDQLAEALAARGPQLLVLDNCEYLAPEAHALIERLLEQAPLARLLATSLAPLRLEDECLFELPPLALDEAAALYEQQALRSGASAPLEREAVELLVDSLDRNPLAIRLAAARARTLRPRHLLARIEQRFSLLRGGPPGRHESLHRALGCSWDLLAPHEASVLAQLAIFAGGFDLEAAEAVVDRSDHPESPPIVEVMDELRGRVLIGAARTDPPRFALAESIRAFALHELRASGRLESTAQRHADHYLALTALAPAAFYTTEQLRRFRPEEENLRAVIRRFEERDPARSSRAALTLAALLEGRGYAACAPDLEAAVLSARAADDPALLAETLRALGKARVNRGAIDEARETLGEAIDRAREAGVPTLECQAAIDLAFAEAMGSTPQDGEALARAEAEKARALGHRALEAYAEQVLCLVANQSGRWEDCAEHLERAIRLYAGGGAPAAEALAVINLGNTRASLGELDVARQLLERGRDLARQAESPLAESLAVLNLGNVAIIGGDLDEAEALLANARITERRLGRPRFEALAAGNLATVAFERGHLREARQLVADALITFRGLGSAYYDGAFSSVYGAVLAASGDLAHAEAEFEHARVCLESTGDLELQRMHGIFEGFLDLARAREAGPGTENHRDRARAKLAAGRDGRPGGPRQIAARILSRALDGWSDARASEPARADAPAGTSLVVGPESDWFELGDVPRVEMRRRKAIRRVLHALVEQRLLSPGIGLEPARLFAAGWPDEVARPAAAAMRVYHAIKVLRQAGFGSALLRHGDGYLIDPALQVVRRQL